MKIMNVVAVIACGLCLLASFTMANDKHGKDISAQSKCTEVTRNRVGATECGWHGGLSSGVDIYYLKGKIAAYKIQWWNNKWSGWFVPGVNDLDAKYNLYPNTCSPYPKITNSLRRMWSYFIDHTHMFILCKDNIESSILPTATEVKTQDKINWFLSKNEKASG